MVPEAGGQGAAGAPQGEALEREAEFQLLCHPAWIWDWDSWPRVWFIGRGHPTGDWVGSRDGHNPVRVAVAPGVWGSGPRQACPWTTEARSQAKGEQGSPSVHVQVSSDTREAKHHGLPSWSQ